MKLKRLALLFVVSLVVVGGLSTTINAQDDVWPATPTVHDAEGNLVATAILIQLGDVVSIEIKNEGLPEGEYGVHIHETGECVGPDFTSAGGHFNPHGKEHGLDANDSDRGHAGDLPNLVVNADGNGNIQWATDQLTLRVGTIDSIFDADGSAIVIHADPDDMDSQPSGNSGPRIACGVISSLNANQNTDVETDTEEPTFRSSDEPFSFGLTELILTLAALAVVAVILMRVIG